MHKVSADVDSTPSEITEQILVPDLYVLTYLLWNRKPKKRLKHEKK